MFAYFCWKSENLLTTLNHPVKSRKKNRNDLSKARTKKSCVTWLLVWDFEHFRSAFGRSNLSNSGQNLFSSEMWSWSLIWFFCVCVRFCIGLPNFEWHSIIRCHLVIFGMVFCLILFSSWLFTFNKQMAFAYITIKYWLFPCDRPWTTVPSTNYGFVSMCVCGR